MGTGHPFAKKCLYGATKTGTYVSNGVRYHRILTAVAEAAQYGFEHTGPNRQFANPNGIGPDPVNGFGGAGGGFVVPGTSFSVTLPASTPPGTYQVRVIGLFAAGQPVGVFSDAVTMAIE